MNSLGKAFSILTRREKRSGAIVLGLIMLKGVADMLGVASIMPFLKVLGDPGFVERNALAARAYEAFGFQSNDQFLLALGCLVIAVLVLSAVMRTAAAYAINRWVMMRGYSLSLRLLDTYLRQPYEFFLDRNTGDLSTYVLSEVHRVVSEAFRPAAELVNGVATFAFMVALLLWAQPLVTVLAVVVIGGIYLILFAALRPLIRRMGAIALASNTARFRTAGEAFSGAKQIKLLGRERSYVDAFGAPALRFARTRATTQTLMQVPRFGLEVLAFGGIIVLTLSLVARHGGASSSAFAETMPLLGLYAFAGYRLLPTLQTIYASASAIRFGAPAVDAIYDDLRKRENTERLPMVPPAPLGLRRSLVLRDVSYRYPGAGENSLTDIDLEIPRGKTIGIVGSTGAGKTTLMDLLLGLIKPTSGAILVDGEPLTLDNIRAWQATVGYVPQEIFLSDASVAQNIALGIAADEILQVQVEESSRLARIHDFVVGELRDGYDTAVGDRGVRLSGGQRQRIGIARALYNDPDVIVFDEATSALDGATEREVMTEIQMLSGTKTVIMIAHRLSTIRACDRIIVLSKGVIVGEGNFSDLSKSNAHFQKLAQGHVSDPGQLGAA